MTLIKPPAQITNQLRIDEIPIENLRPFPNNPRTWNTSQEKHLTESIKEFGIVLPLLVNNAKDKENIVIGGSFRLSVYKKMGIKIVPIVYISISDDKKAQELNLRLNRNHGEWDWNLLKDYEIIDLMSVGFDEIDLGKFWDNELGVEDDHFDIKKAKENVLKNPTAKVGDVFQLGSHTIICGDCTNASVLKELGKDAPINYINCDPPYNISLDYSKGIGNTAQYGGKEKDNRSLEDYRVFLKTSLQNALSISQKDAHCFYWCDENFVGLLQMLYQELNISNKRLCIWIKNNQNVTPQIAFNKVTEYCVYGTIGKPYLNLNTRNLNEIQNKEISSGNRLTDDITDLFNIWLTDRLPIKEYQHPTTKPPTLYEKALRRCTKVGDFVLDLFGGSGSQLIACEQLKRRALLVEIDPVFVDLILYRYEKLTGNKPVKLN